MIIQHPPVGVSPSDLTRPRRWAACFLAESVIVRHYAILAPGEDLTEYPPTHQLPRAEWATRCAEYGLDAAGLGPGDGPGAAP